jgi:hypothetical protein
MDFLHIKKISYHMRILLVSFLFVPALVLGSDIDPTKLIKDALNQWRGDSSYSEISMKIHRPSWDRSSSLKSWTQGSGDSIVRFVAPISDAGNALLKKETSLWIYNPKLAQVMKLPYSMMAQNWGGSDFSYNDLSKTDQIVTDYTHRLDKVEQKGSQKLYHITATPKPSAPIVWGKIALVVRDDNILMSETWYDQSNKAVRQLQTLKVTKLGGREYPVVMRMTPLDKEDHYTQLTTTKATFNIEMPGYMFTLSNLRNPRPWSEH